MNRFVIDNSVVISWYFKDETNAYTKAVLRGLDKAQAIVPAIWPLELSNALLMTERRKRLTEAETVYILSVLHSMSISIEQEPLERVWAEIVQLARTQRLSTYDASYLDLAMRMGLPIATLDKALKNAASKVKVPIYKP